MRFELSETTQVYGYGLKEFAFIGSTNAEALQDAQNGAVGRCWYVTKDQRSGRGRRGREWQARAGNLAASLLLVHDYPLERAATLSFVAGLSLVEAVEQLLPATDTQFRLKWPNDVLANDAKLSGILLESAMLKDGRKALVIGIGVNVEHIPDNVPYAVTSLKQSGFDRGAEVLLMQLAERFAENFALWHDGAGMDLIRQRWLRYAARLGQTIRVQIGTELVEGVFSDIDAEGHLILTLPQGRRQVVSAGEVFFGETSR